MFSVNACSCFGVMSSEVLIAGVAQLVEYELPKLGVAGSNPVARSIFIGVFRIVASACAVLNVKLNTLSINYHVNGYPCFAAGSSVQFSFKNHGKL